MMSILQSILSDISTLAGVAAFIAWWAAIYLGVQMSRYRHEPEAPAFRRRWEVSMLVFVGFFIAGIAFRVVAEHL